MEPFDSFIFPVEIFEHILDEVEECTASRIANLKSCAMVCKLFASICQPRVFQYINIGSTSNTFSTRGGEIYRLVYLAKVLKNRPNLTNSVKELSIGPWPSIDVGEPDTRTMVVQLSSLKDTFFHFSNLQGLSVKTDSDDFDSSENAQVLSTLCVELVQTYSSQPSVNTMSIHLDPTPLQEILSSPYLRTLRLEGIHYPTSDIIHPTTSLLTHLTIDIRDVVPFSLLSYFPCLETLHLWHITDFQDTDGPAHPLPKTLTELEISFDINSSAISMCRFADHYISAARSPGFDSAFEALLTLKVICDLEEDLDATRMILQHAPSLRCLHIQCDILANQEFTEVFLPELDNIVRGVTVCPRLAELNLRVLLSIVPDTAPLEGLLTSLAKFFANISRKNKLESLTLQLNMCYPVTPEFPCGKSWSQIANVLSLPTGFPKLRKVHIDLTLVNSWGPETQNTLVDISEHEKKYRDLMRDLALRKDVIFKGSVHMSDSE